jgi:hypothetical protein
MPQTPTELAAIRPMPGDHVDDDGVFIRPPPGLGWRVLDAHVIKSVTGRFAKVVKSSDHEAGRHVAFRGVAASEPRHA